MNEYSDKQLTKEEAIAFCESRAYEKMTHEEIFTFQLFQRLLCIPFNIFHEAAEKVLRRPVWTHEFAFHSDLVKEYWGEKEAPTLDDIINLIPEDKRIIIGM